MSQHIQAAIEQLDKLLATPNTAGSNTSQNGTSEQSSTAEKSKKGALPAASYSWLAAQQHQVLDYKF